jgi:hypothetical protein
MQIDSDDPAVTEALTRLRRVVQDAGGAFNPAMTVLARGGDLSVMVPATTDPEVRLLQLPAACMPDLGATEVGVVEDAFTLSPPDPDQTATSSAAMAGLVDVYNACGKVAWWRATCPWLALARDPDVLGHLTALRAANPKTQAYQGKVAAGAWDSLLVDSFMGTRMFRLKPADRADAFGDSSAADSSAAPTPVFMPFVECLNHNFDARPYQTTVDGDGIYRLWTYADRPYWNSRECFVLYTLLDPIDSLLFYGFVDESGPVLHSAPATLDLPEDITITIEAGPWQLFQGDLPATLQDIRVFIPPTKARDGGHITLPWLLIPGAKTPWALRRTLRAFIYALRPDLPESRRREIVGNAEIQLLAANHDALDLLANAVAKARPDPPEDPPDGRDGALDAVDHAVTTARARLDAYAERLGIDPP